MSWRLLMVADDPPPRTPAGSGQSIHANPVPAAASAAATNEASSPRRRLIITADDFGLHPRVNEAVEQAHLNGVLTAASLMVGAPFARDAVTRAFRLPDLRVGLHLVLADGTAVLPRSQIAALVDMRGRFGDDMVHDGFRFFFLPHVRKQLAQEIRAQFEAFAKTGLT